MSAQAAINSLQLKLIATVASEVLVSPLPVLRMLKNSRGSVGAPGIPSKRDSTSENPAAMGLGGVGAAAAAAAAAGDGRWMGMGIGSPPPPTVTRAWAAKRRADWETLEVGCTCGFCLSEGARSSGVRAFTPWVHVVQP